MNSLSLSWWQDIQYIYIYYIHKYYNIYCTHFVCIPLHALYMRHMAYFLHIQLTYTKLIENRRAYLYCCARHAIWGEPDTSRRIEIMMSSSLRVCQYPVTVVLPQKLHLINGLWLTQSLASRDGYKISLNLLQLGLWVHVPNVSGCCREWQWFVRWETYSNENSFNLGMEVQHAMQSIMPGMWRCNFDMYFLPGDIVSLMEGLSSINIMGSFAIYIYIYIHIFIWFSENILLFQQLLIGLMNLQQIPRFATNTFNMIDFLAVFPGSSKSWLG